MANFIRFTDFVEFKPISVESAKKYKDFVTTTDSAPLYVKIAATHAGIITRNNGFYLPDRMKKGAPTFTANYQKPIQLHHNDDKDPIGRVIRSSYIDTTGSVKDKFAARVRSSYRGNRFSDAFIDGFLDHKLPFIDSVNFIVDALNVKDSILEDPDYQGLGYIELTAAITDPEAKQKILDGRYLTGSVGATSTSAICSICKHDLISDGMKCEHRPGRIYDGAKAFIIAGNLNYDEYSFVNTPADRHSRILELNVNGIADSVEMDNSFGKTFSVEIFTDSVDTINSNVKIEFPEGKIMHKEALLALIDKLALKYSILKEEDVVVIKNSVDSFVGQDELDASIAIEVAFDTAALNKIFALTDASAKKEALKAICLHMEDSQIETLSISTYKDASEFYTAVTEAEWNDYSELEDEVLTALVAEDKELKDAKLSTSQRKKLPGSTFCGPNKSFPVPDCAHVTAARRLIGRASASSATKSKILACVSRKSSAMGCGKAKDSVKDSKATETVEITSKIKFEDGRHIVKLDKYDEPVEILVLEDKEVIQGPGKIVIELPFVTELTTELNTLKTGKDAVTVELEALKTEKAEFTKTVDALRTELKITHEDLVQVNDRLVTQEESLLTLKATRLITFKQLSGETIEDAVKLTDTLVALGTEALDKQLTEIATKVDMKKIADSINSGLSRSPNGTVSDPGLSLENENKVYDKAQVANVAETYIAIKMGSNHPYYGHGVEAAEKYRRDMQIRGIIPSN